MGLHIGKIFHKVEKEVSRSGENVEDAVKDGGKELGDVVKNNKGTIIGCALAYFTGNYGALAQGVASDSKNDKSLASQVFKLPNKLSGESNLGTSETSNVADLASLLSGTESSSGTSTNTTVALDMAKSVFGDNILGSTDSKGSTDIASIIASLGGNSDNKDTANTIAIAAKVLPYIMG